jgi:glycosyltransferase involved in cell wall biosynthesis
VTCILHLVGSSRGGGAVHVLDLAALLQPRQFQVMAAMPEDGGNVTAGDFADRNVPFREVDMAGGPSLKAVQQLRGLLRTKGVDILHCHGARAAFYGRVAAASLGSKRPRIVYSLHGFTAPFYPLPKKIVLLTIEQLLSRYTEAFIAVSEAERQSFLAAGFAATERVFLIRYGIHAERFADVVVNAIQQKRALGVPEDSTLVTTVCRLFFPKDVETLVKAFALVRSQFPNAHLLVVGDGPYRPRIESLIADLDLASHVTLAGLRRDIPQTLAASDVFALATTDGEGLPITILEAMSASLPVVASDVTGVREEVTHEETGLVVPPRDPSALSKALVQLLTSTEEAKSMGKKGRQRIEQYFTLERMARETAEVYESVMLRQP